MNNNNNPIQTSFLSSEETIQLVTDGLPSTLNLQNNTKKISNMLSQKISTEHRLMRWCALILTLSTLIIIWRYITILILSIWLSSICRPILEWLVNHLPLMNRCREKRSRSAIAAFLLVFLVLVVILPIILIIIALTGSTINFVASISNSTTARHAINLIVPPTNDNFTKTGVNQTSDYDFVGFIRGGKNATFHLFERLLMQRDTITDVLQLFGGQALSVISTVAGVTAQFIIGLLIFLVSTYSFLLHGNELWTWVLQHSPLSKKHMNRFYDAFHETGRGLLIGVCLTCAVQGFVAAIAYLCLQIPRWYALGVLTGLCSLIPILGTAIVWIPITIGLFIQQAYVKAVIMITVGVLAIGSIDNLLRPVFSKLGSLQMSTLLLLLTIFGGLELVGPWGALLGPLIVRLATEAIILVREDEDEELNSSTTHM
ncbi:unnamed protein product [Adineta steineri]|uniref:AI-2E family transporter n=1 Tax=Adineta steineri TaxID=433720 RepID=A0A819CW64_9BILA|nr:unnamed protein product [Adineta steineri]